MNLRLAPPPAAAAGDACRETNDGAQSRGRSRTAILTPVRRTTTTPATGRPYLDEVLPDDAGGPGRSVLALAHRGGAFHPELEGLENTLEAFRHAVALGYRYLETDVHVTADGVLLALHDTVLDRVTDRRGEVAALTHTEVRRARIGGRAEVPTLAALLDELPGARFNIDLKSDGAVRPLADLVAARGQEDDVLVGSFSRARLREFRRLTGGRVATSAAPVEVAAFLARPSRRAPFDALQVPRRRGPLPIVTARLVRRAHAAGKHVHVWTVDEPEEVRELLALGVDGLFTDRTDVLRSVLVEQGLWRESR